MKATSVRSNIGVHIKNMNSSKSLTMNTLVVIVTILSNCYIGLPVESRETDEDRMIGNQYTSIDQNPYQISVEYYGTHICAGAIIGSEWVLTAAHCLVRITPLQIEVRAGTTTRGFGGTVHKVSKIIPHPNHFWNRRDNDFDICLIRVSTPFEFNDQIQPIPITTNEPLPGHTGIVTGWGAISYQGPLLSQLQFKAVPIVDREICDEDELFYAGMTVNKFCAGEDGGDACLDDFGNPLVVDGQLAGLLIWNIGCHVPGHPEVYANVATLRDFVTIITVLK